MNDRWNDDERLAAFLDGRLEGPARDEMLAHLTRDDDDYEVIVGTAAILRAMEDAGAAARPDAAGISPRAETRVPAADPPHDVLWAYAGNRLAGLRWLALAAVLAGVALAGGLALRSRASAGHPVSLAARLEHAADGLPVGWNERRPWASARGDDAVGGASPGERAARAARAGVLLVDLAVAVQGRDAARTRLFARQIASRFDPQGRVGALRKIEAGAGSPPERLEPLLAQATGRIAAPLERDALGLGAWTEAARLAAARQDAAFFRDGQTRRMLERAARLTAADPPVRAALQRVRLLLPGAGPPRWDALAPALDALLFEVASG